MILASALFSLMSTVAMAQGNPPPPMPPPPPGLPVDGPILLLLIAGLIYGIYKTLALRKSG